MKDVSSLSSAWVSFRDGAVGILHAVGVGLVLLVQVAAATAEEDVRVDHRAEALQITMDAAKTYEFELSGDRPTSLEFHAESILRWSNPIAGEVYGNVFVWTHKGRPEIIGSLHQWLSPFSHGSHEFHSLATGPVRGARDDRSVWVSKLPGIELHRLPGRSTVSNSPSGRSNQLRTHARQFRLQKTDREGISRELRLLTQPIYRYPAGHPSVLDGAIFVFVQGTDPEVFLLIESRKTRDEWEWQYAFARMNSVQFVAKLNEQTVWSVETWPWSKTKNGTEPYTQFGPFNRATTTN